MTVGGGGLASSWATRHMVSLHHQSHYFDKTHSFPWRCDAVAKAARRRGTGPRLLNAWDAVVVEGCLDGYSVTINEIYVTITLGIVHGMFDFISYPNMNVESMY